MSSYKDFASNEAVNTKTLLYEAIPITGSIVSGTYSELNIKSYSHGIFTSVYDYPYLSSSANHLFDLTVGYSTGSAASASAVVASNTASSKKKLNLYYQMAKVLAGQDTSGSILLLDEDGNFNNIGDLIHNAFFVNFSRLLAKDEIKRGSFQLTLGVGTGSGTPFSNNLLISDSSGSLTYKINSPVGDYGILYASSVDSYINPNPACGMIFYQAGVAVINTNVFALSSSNNPQTNVSSNTRGLLLPSSFNSTPKLSGSYDVGQLLASGSINDFGFGIRSRIKNITFNNTTEVNSSIYFCKIPSTDFNYSSNETYLSGSKIVVKSKKEDQPVSYFTTVGLYSKSNQLLAVAKLSEPIKKDPNTDLTIRVRLDF
jgi:hypothetical protein